MTEEEKILKAELIEVIIRNFASNIVFENKKDLNIYILTQMLEENLRFETRVFGLPTTNNNEFMGRICSAENINNEELCSYDENEYLIVEFLIKSKNDEINIKHLNI
jgi:hypothetical protein